MPDTLIQEPPAPQETPPTGAPRRRPTVAPLIWGGAMIVVGVLWLLQMLGLDVPWSAIAPLGVIAVGLALLIGSRTGTHGGLIALGIVLTVLSAITVTFHGPFDVGDRTYRPTSVAELPEAYELGVGNLVVDLRGVDFASDDTELTVRLNVGDLRILLPDDVIVAVDSTIGIGELRVLDRRQSGLGPHIQLLDDPPGDSGVLTLRTSVGVGNVEVVR